MSAAANEPRPAQAKGPGFESQDDAEETQMEYDPSGGLPWWIALIWVTFSVSVAAYGVRLYLPALKAWLAEP
jgi:hypothetical protein